MPIEPLQTDEKLSQPSPRVRDMDSAMLGGCASFSLASIAAYALAAWPFFALAPLHESKRLAMAIAAGLVPALALGAFASRRAGLPGGAGAIGGALAASVFLHFELQRIFTLAGDPRMAQPDYPRSLVWLVPAAWLAANLALVALAMPKEDAPDKPEGW